MSKMYHFRIILFISIFFLIGSVGCEKEELENEWFIAKVIATGIDTDDIFLIGFMLNDKEEILQILGLENDTWFPTCDALNLPNEFKINGLPVRVKCRKPKRDEIEYRTANNPGYPQIWIKEIEELK